MQKEHAKNRRDNKKVEHVREPQRDGEHRAEEETDEEHMKGDEMDDVGQGRHREDGNTTKSAAMKARRRIKTNRKAIDRDDSDEEDEEVEDYSIEDSNKETGDGGTYLSVLKL